MGDECEDVKCGFYATCQMTRDLTGSDNEVNDDVTNIRDVTRSTMTSLMKSLVNAVAPDASVPLSAQRSAMTVA